MTRHRGAHPQDADQFGPDARARLRRAVADLSWLRTRGYGDNAALKLVGNRYGLKRRQRNAVARSACTDAQRSHRRSACCSADGLRGAAVAVDGFNQLITLEAVLGTAYVFIGRDEAVRDVNPVQGSYRPVAETDPAIEAAGAVLAPAASVQWLLDTGVSNVGRVRSRLEAAAERHGWAWTVEQSDEVDRQLAESPAAVATSDSGILDRVDRWVNLAALVLEHQGGTNVCDLRPDAAATPG